MIQSAEVAERRVDSWVGEFVSSLKELDSLLAQFSIVLCVWCEI